MKRHLFSMLFVACLLPVPVFATGSSDNVLKTLPDIEKLQSQKAQFNFYLFINKAELKTKGDKFVLVVPKADRNYQIVYQSVAPKQIAGTILASDFQQYWAEGKTFNKIPPTVILSASEKKGGKRDINYFVNFTAMTDDGKTLSFELNPMPGQTLKAGELHGVFVTVDPAGYGAATG